MRVPPLVVPLSQPVFITRIINTFGISSRARFSAAVQATCFDKHTAVPHYHTVNTNLDGRLLTWWSSDGATRIIYLYCLVKWQKIIIKKQSISIYNNFVVVVDTGSVWVCWRVLVCVCARESFVSGVWDVFLLLLEYYTP